MRIIAGSARGRTFDAPEGRSTRPTLDRVREAMFGMIQFDVQGAYVLDLFAGSGALGLEALSRGAEHAVFCDVDRSVCRLIERNLSKLGFSDRADVFCQDAIRLIDRLSAEGRRFSIVLIDPPYESGLYVPTLSALASSGVLEEGCIILVEHSARSAPDFSSLPFDVFAPRRYGDSAVTKLIFPGGIKENE